MAGWGVMRIKSQDVFMVPFQSCLRAIVLLYVVINVKMEKLRHGDFIIRLSQVRINNCQDIRAFNRPTSFLEELPFLGL